MDVRGRIFELAAAKNAQPPKKRAEPFAADLAWKWIKSLPDPRLHSPMMKFAHWLWNTGTKDMDFLIFLLEDRIRRNPECPYAYYAPNGPARVNQHDARAIEQAEQDNNRLKQEERAWLESR